MTESSRKRGFPVWALILDVLGTLLLAIGIYSIVTGGLPFAGNLELGYVGVALIIVGALLMLPFIVVIVQRSVARQ